MNYYLCNIDTSEYEYSKTLRVNTCLLSEKELLIWYIIQYKLDVFIYDIDNINSYLKNNTEKEMIKQITSFNSDLNKIFKILNNKETILYYEYENTQDYINTEILEQSNVNFIFNGGSESMALLEHKIINNLSDDIKEIYERNPINDAIKQSLNIENEELINNIEDKLYSYIENQIYIYNINKEEEENDEDDEEDENNEYQEDYEDEDEKELFNNILDNIKNKIYLTENNKIYLTKNNKKYNIISSFIYNLYNIYIFYKGKLPNL
jgi:hypothetical protein